MSNHVTTTDWDQAIQIILRYKQHTIKALMSTSSTPQHCTNKTLDTHYTLAAKLVLGCQVIRTGGTTTSSYCGRHLHGMLILPVENITGKTSACDTGRPLQWRCCVIHAIGSKVSGIRCLNANCTDMENILFANSLTQTSTTCDLQLKMSDFFKKTPIKNFGAPWSKDSTWKNRTRHFGVNYKRMATQMVWSHISDGFQQDSTSDGLDPSALQKKERTSDCHGLQQWKKIWVCSVWHGMKLWI